MFREKRFKMLEDLPNYVFLLILSFIPGDIYCSHSRRLHFDPIVRISQISKKINNKVKYLDRTFWNNKSTIIDQMMAGKCSEFRFLVNVNIYSLLNSITDEPQLLFILDHSWSLSSHILMEMIENCNFETYLLIHEKIINDKYQLLDGMSEMTRDTFLWFLLIKDCNKHYDTINFFLNTFLWDFCLSGNREQRNKFYKTLPMETLVFLSNRGIPMFGKILRKRMKASQPLF